MVPIPNSHTRFQLPRSAPLPIQVTLQAWSAARNIFGYSPDGSFRFDSARGQQVAHCRLLSYFNYDHSTRDFKYNGTWVVIPPFSDPIFQNRLWVLVSRLLGRCNGYHPNYRLADCSSPEHVSVQMQALSLPPKCGSFRELTRTLQELWQQCRDSEPG